MWLYDQWYMFANIVEFSVWVGIILLVNTLYRKCMTSFWFPAHKENSIFATASRPAQDIALFQSTAVSKWSWPKDVWSIISTSPQCLHSVVLRHGENFTFYKTKEFNHENIIPHYYVTVEFNYKRLIEIITSHNNSVYKK